MSQIASKHLEIGRLILGNDLPFILIGGPDSIESEEHALFMAKELKAICEGLSIPFVFKASFDKANRTSVDSFRGVGLEEGLRILKRIKDELEIPVTSDIHMVSQAKAAGEVLDIIQLPALLSRQTDLIVAAGETGKPVNVKKGQFVAPQNVDGIIGKMESTGNQKLLLTERGYMFGYNNIVADMRSIEIMKQSGFPVIFDASHTAQLPSSDGKSSGGNRDWIPPLARAAVAVGVAGIFMEIHDDPENALVDGPSSLELSKLKEVLESLKAIDQIIKA